MFKNRTEAVTILLSIFLGIGIIIVTTFGLLKKDYPCETFLPDPVHYGPGQQCRDDKRTYLKIYDNGNALCVCKENIK